MPSSSRRGSASFVPKALPYRVQFSCVDAGKIIPSSKKIVVWRFGYPDVDYEQNVTLKHSVTGGKKVILENGKEIVRIDSQHVVGDFAHGWESQGHVLRIAVSTSGVYTFSVDSVPFEEFPPEYKSKNTMAQDEAKHKKEVESHHDKPKRRTSAGEAKKPDLVKRHSATFDPFSSGGSASAQSSSSFFDFNDQDNGFGSSDPFGEAPSKTKNSDPFTDGFGSTSNNSANSGSFNPDSFFDNKEKAKAKGPTPKLSRQFTSPPEQYDSASSDSNAFNSQDFFSDNSSPVQQKPKQSNISPPKSSATVDFFADNSPTNEVQQTKQRSAQSSRSNPAQTSVDFFGDNDMPATQNTQSSSSSSVFDFTGMTYDIPATPPMQSSYNNKIPDAFAPQDQQAAHQQLNSQQPQKAGNKDHFGLVNLDFSAASSSSKPARKKSIYDDAGGNVNKPPQTQHQNHSSDNPFDSFVMPPTNQAPNNWMASGNIGMMTDQGGFMSQASNQGKSSGQKTSLDTLDWRM